MVLTVQFKSESCVIKERISVSFSSSSIVKWKRANSSKIIMYLLHFLSLFWFCERLFERFLSPEAQKSLETKVCLRVLCVTSLHLHERMQTSHRLCLGRDCVGKSNMIPAVMAQELWPEHSTLILSCEMKSKGTRVVGLKVSLQWKRGQTSVSFTSYHRWMERKLQHCRKCRIQMNTNLEYKWAHNAFWGSITIVVLEFWKDQKKWAVLKLSVLWCTPMFSYFSWKHQWFTIWNIQKGAR